MYFGVVLLVHSSQSTMVLVEDLQRCRRMVAGMRGLVIASSLRLQLLKESQEELARRETMRRTSAAAMTPRTRYIRHFRMQRVVLIQRQWRKHRRQRLILEKIKIERRWRARRGNKRMEQSATAIQRVFRGFRLRTLMRERDAGHPSILGLVVETHHQSRLERRRDDRMLFRKRLEGKRSALYEAKRQMRIVVADKEATGQRISKASSDQTGLYIDAKLLDGTVVRMQAHQLLLHQAAEIERLDGIINRLESEMRELQNGDSVVQQAAVCIQTQYRRYVAHRRRSERVKGRRNARVRLRLSCERCYERMNAGFFVRQQELWHRNARVIAGLYHIIIAKRLLKLYREQRAAAKIQLVYMKKRDRVEAQERAAWRKTKRQAQRHSESRKKKTVRSVWAGWRLVVDHEKQRQVRIAELLANGQMMWIVSKAVKLQRLARRLAALRRTLTDEIVPVLNPVLSHRIHTVVAAHTESTPPRDISLCFYEKTVQDMLTWRAPEQHMYCLARRYMLPLDPFPLDDIWRWLLNHQQNESVSSGWSIDLRSPCTIRTLRFLAPLSSYYDQHDHISLQLEQIWIFYEAAHTMRHYLIMLYEHDAVVFTPASSFSAKLRAERIRRLILRNDEERSESPRTTAEQDVVAFTTFHSIWNDLCENCLAMESNQFASECSVCGHKRLERSTAARAGHAAMAQNVAAAPRDTERVQSARWVRGTERCDFVIANAFFHALAPRGHAHRELYTPDVLWRIALSKAVEPVRVLYEEYDIHSLDELLDTETTDKWNAFLPAPVLQKVQLFQRLLLEELITIQEGNGGARWLVFNSGTNAECAPW